MGEILGGCGKQRNGNCRNRPVGPKVSEEGEENLETQNSSSLGSSCSFSCYKSGPNIHEHHQCDARCDKRIFQLPSHQLPWRDPDSRRRTQRSWRHRRRLSTPPVCATDICCTRETLQTLIRRVRL